MFEIISKLSLFIRTNFINLPVLPIISNSSYNAIINLFLQKYIIYIIYLLSFGITSIYYKRGSAPIIGSISYFTWYLINVKIFNLVGSITTNIYIYSLLLVLIYVLITVSIYKIKESINN